MFDALSFFYLMLLAVLFIVVSPVIIRIIKRKWKAFRTRKTKTAHAAHATSATNTNEATSERTCTKCGAKLSHDGKGVRDGDDNDLEAGRSVVDQLTTKSPSPLPNPFTNEEAYNVQVVSSTAGTRHYRMIRQVEVDDDLLGPNMVIHLNHGDFTVLGRRGDAVSRFGWISQVDSVSPGIFMQ